MSDAAKGKLVDLEIDSFKRFTGLGTFVVFDPDDADRTEFNGLHPNIRLVIPTRGCARWLPYFLRAYRSWNIEPTYAVDRNCDSGTLAIIKEHGVKTIFIDVGDIPNGESIMPFLSTHVEEDYLLRLDDDEFPTLDLIKWVNSIPDSAYSFVTSWWTWRHEVALLDGELQTCHPKWMRIKTRRASFDTTIAGGRFFRHKDAIYGQVGAHHGNFISEYVSHAPSEALMIHLDCVVRSVEERLAKIRSVETRFPDAGWIFANHTIPEMAPRELLHLKPFDRSDVKHLVDSLVENVYRPTEEVTLKISEIVKIQGDHLTLEVVHQQL